MRPIPPHAANNSRRWLISFGLSGLMAIAASWWLGLLPGPEFLLQLSPQQTDTGADAKDENSSPSEPVATANVIEVEQWEPGMSGTSRQPASLIAEPSAADMPTIPSSIADPFPQPDEEQPRRPPLFPDDRSAFEPLPSQTVPASETAVTDSSIVPVAAESKIPEPYAAIDALIEEGKYLEAHRDLSKLYWNKPEESELILPRIEQTAKIIYLSPQPHFMDPYEIQPGDLLQKIAPNYKISWEYLAKLNRVQPEKIRAGQKLKVIKGPFAAFIDLSDYRLTIHAHGYFVKQYAIGIGKENSTPIGTFSVKDRLRNPVYYGPDGVVAADDPTNPLGECWIDLGDSYGIHGTIDPNSIGKAESRGCVRLVAADVAEVYDFLTVGSEVVIRP